MNKTTFIYLLFHPSIWLKSDGNYFYAELNIQKKMGDTDINAVSEKEIDMEL